MERGYHYRRPLNAGLRNATALHQIPNLQMVGPREARHRIQPQILSPPLHHLVILVFHAAQRRCLLLRQFMALPQLAEAFSEELGGGKMIGHPCRFGIVQRANTVL